MPGGARRAAGPRVPRFLAWREHRDRRSSRLRLLPRARRGDRGAGDARRRPPLVVAVVARAARRRAFRRARAAAPRPLLRDAPVRMRDRRRPVHRRAPRTPPGRADRAARAPSPALPERARRDVRGSSIRRRGGALGVEPAFVAKARRDGESMDEGIDGRLSGEELEEALVALLYDENARARLRAGEVVDARFAALAVDELEETARAVRRMVRSRAHRGTGNFEAWFPRTLAAWRTAHPD